VTPGDAFYETCATITVSLYIALSIELRLTSPRPDPATLNTTPGQRGLVGLVLFTLLASAVGLACDLGALAEGGSPPLTFGASIGVVLISGLFLSVTTDALVVVLLGRTLATTKRQSIVLVAIGGLLLIVGTVVLLVAV
jgi:hypothetical protein